MAHYEAVADAAKIAEGRMGLFHEALRDKAERRVAEERRAAGEEVERPEPRPEPRDHAPDR